MTRKPESIFSDKVIKDLKAAFGKNVSIHNIQQVGINGTPDLLLCLHGKFVALELKIDTASVIAPLQIIKLLEINHAGGYGIVVYPYTWARTLDVLKINHLQ